MKKLFFASLLFLLATAAFSADQFVFQYGTDGYEKTMDTHITEYSGNSTNNMGGNIENECCEYNPANTDGKSLLIYFDVSSIKQNAVVAKATLELYLTQTRNGTNKKQVAAHRLLKEWAEGKGSGIDGVAAKQDEVCGKWTGKGEDWAKAGADEPGKDFVEKADDTIELEGKPQWYEWNITKMCQDWIANPKNNFGAILLEPRPHAATLGTKVFASKEYADKTLRPKLTVTVSAYPVDVRSMLTATWGEVKTHAR